MSKFRGCYLCDCGQFVDVFSDAKPGTCVQQRCPHCDEFTLVGLEDNKEYKVREKTSEIQGAILNIFRELKPRLTVRQVYYALTVRDVVPKTEKGYRQAQYHLGAMRKKGILPYGWIADNTRWHIKPNTYSGLNEAMKTWETSYRRDIWVNQKDSIEIWVEKDALAGVISPITEEYDVPLYVARGYGSMTFIFEAAESIKKGMKPVYIYHFGDFDPSGVDAANKIRDGLKEHGAYIHFKRVAIIEEQIEVFNLPTRKTKRSDPRAKNWGNKPSVELDALPAPNLRSLVKECIEAHVDTSLLDTTRQIEAFERNILSDVRNNFVQEQKSYSAGGEQ